jgi:hypothetical protein
MQRSNSIGIVVIASILLLVGAAGIITAAQPEDSGSDIEISVQGNGVVDSDGQAVTVWASESVTFSLGPTSDRAGEHYIYCLDPEWTDDDYECQQGTLSSNEKFDFRVSSNELSPGEYHVTARIHEDGLGYDNPLIEEIEVDLRVIRKSGDIDEDGLSNEDEVNRGTDFDDPDSDGDGLADGKEINRYNTDPLASDSDRDGLSDGVEVTEFGTDPNSRDTDNDGLEDGEEVNEHNTDPTVADSDGDGFDDGAEIKQGTDPNDPDQNPGSGDSETVEKSNDQPTDGSSSSDSSSLDPSDSESDSADEEEFQRGFLTNDPDSGLAILQDPFNITFIGFVLSIVGILFQLRGVR